MIRETAILPDFPDYHGFWGFDPGKSLFFDIETSGLSAASSHVFLIGTICRTEHGWQLTQYLAERTSEEPELLAAFLADAAPFSTLIHFNGTTFDLPYINARARACHLPILYDDASDCIFSIDLYQKLRRLEKALRICTYEAEGSGGIRRMAARGYIDRQAFNRYVSCLRENLGSRAAPPDAAPQSR